MEGIKIRKMSRADILQVWAIGKQCFTTPWQLSSFEYELGNRDAILKVAVLDNEIIAYVCIRSILDMTHVLDLAVTPGYRRMGIGSMLLGNALQELRRSNPGASIITLEVRESNIAAVKLYEGFGFKEIGRRRGYYQKPHEDAIIMDLDMKADNSPITFH
ncbi:MAG TPA: ribosomal-protein-alanine N-acetyltransferase [Nitrospirae bacterium]|nr:ribosomal-protein-alanine N-acetyltransferase [bacterium BMS3Abin06]HDH11362.1 ribosomal-protein-alanine N-acetyltransferase [Nitrospirota bacterium]HDZ03373.1 ribosomal-protein-alanine N-acetyltransferase [Nitrospirota bacterium]